ncbi:MAG: DinB family protein [Dehalococcoidia bacterium]|nr:DinB family protein [Dehalococcoidia bacterium]
MRKTSPSTRPGKGALRGLLEGTRKRLFDSISRLTEEQMYRRVEAGLPSIAEVLAHLPQAERAMRAEAEAVARGDRRAVAFPSPQQEREWAAAAERMVPPQMVNDLVGARWQTLRFLDSLNSRDLSRKAEASGSVLTVAEMVRRIAAHEDEHAEQIMRLRQQFEQGTHPRREEQRQAQK